jgi:hypothetical protein
MQLTKSHISAISKRLGDTTNAPRVEGEGGQASLFAHGLDMLKQGRIAIADRVNRSPTSAKQGWPEVVCTLSGRIKGPASIKGRKG